MVIVGCFMLGPKILRESCKQIEQEGSEQIDFEPSLQQDRCNLCANFFTAIDLFYV
jgi:hypothetical protein